jgi:anti-sigma28 factor (negative regulator of flagellin synthesis)
MKINDPNLNGTVSSGVSKTHEAEAAAKGRSKVAEGASSSHGDHVQLSNLGSQLRAEETESPQRTAYLEKLSAQVKSGTYKVDSAELSKTIVNDAITESGR